MLIKLENKKLVYSGWSIRVMGILAVTTKAVIFIETCSLQVHFLPSPPSSQEKSAHTNDSHQHILNTIFPLRYGLHVSPKLTWAYNATKRWCSRQWTEGNDLWMQQVSSMASTREDVIKLGELLDTELQQRRARETGICPIRRELYSQCFGKVVAEDQCLFG